MNELGQKIKQLRKYKNITLAELAGAQMTKGMLSLIENGKSKPSMESLNYIAARLDTTPSELLGKGNEEITDVLYKQLHELYQRLSFDKSEDTLKLISPHINDIKDNSKGAYIYELYALAQLFTNNTEKTLFYLKKAIDIYSSSDNINSIVEAEKLYISYHIKLREYDKALDKSIEIYEKFKNNPSLTDQNTLPLLLLTISSLHNDPKKKLYFCLEAKKVCIKNKTFLPLYMIIKNLCLIYSINNNMDEFKKEYEEFTYLEHFLFDDFSFIFAKYSVEIFHLFNTQKYNELLNKLNDLNKIFKETSISVKELDLWDSNFLVVLKGIALYHLKHFSEAEAQFKLFKDLNLFIHPMDLSLLAQRLTYQALIAEKNQNREQALNYSHAAIHEIRNIHDNHFTEFIKTTHERLINKEN